MPSTPTLSADRVRELIDAFEILQPSWNGSNARGNSRVQLCAPIVIAPVDSRDSVIGEPFAVLMHDLSESGLGFLHTAKLRGGERFVLAEHPSLPVTKTFAVVYSTPTEDGRFRVGGRFDETLADHDRLRADLQRYVISKSILR